jgi:hypothetical protein
MSDKPLAYRVLIRILRRYGVAEDKRRGKGSHRLLVGYVEGHKRSYPIKCHKESEVKPIPVVQAVRRAFNLTAEHGVSDDEFYR